MGGPGRGRGGERRIGAVDDRRRDPSSARRRLEDSHGIGAGARLREGHDESTLEGELGAGGMATVYRARDLRHGREVAVKVLSPAIAAALSPERFLQEIQIAAQLQHPHIQCRRQRRAAVEVEDAGVAPVQPRQPPPLRTVLLGLDPHIDAALLQRQVGVAEQQITAEQFSSVTAENVMKWAEVEAVRGTYTWEKADQMVAFAKKNKQLVRGHTLLWHRQAPAWMFEGVTAGDAASLELLKMRLKAHIEAMVERYADVVDNWDVVNEFRV